LASQSENDALAGLMEAANCPILCIDSIAPITAHSVQPVDCSGDDLALIQFSSGSTGEPKGICLSRHNVASNINAILNRCEWTAKDVALSWLPLYHDLGLISATLSSLWAGSGLILYPPIAFVRNPIDWLKKASEYGATMSCAPQFAYSLCAAKVEIDSTVLRGLDFAPMRWFFNGSEFIHWDTCAQFERLLAPYGLRPNAVQPGYGLAENCVGVTLRTPLTPVKLIQVTRDQVPMMAGSADVRNVTLVGNGTPIDGTKIAIRSDEGADLPDGTIGHVYISGDATTSTYLRADGQSFKATVSGWLATGDLGIFVEEELFIVGRSKEIIKKGGRTISPPDVEASLVDSLRLPLGGVAVFSFHSEDGGGERIVVIVEVRRSQMENEMTDMLVKMKAHLARAFHFQVDAAYIGPRGCLLRTSSGKLRRGELANLAAAGTLRDKIGLRQLHSFKQATIENSC
jgi:acyl-CoA synthetase (AMP-forming)/AMP-acid ligase II